MMSGIRWLLEGTGKDGKSLKLVISTDDLNRVVGTGYVPAGGGVPRFSAADHTAFRRRTY